MDFLDPKKRRAHTVRLYIGYVLVGIAILIGSLVLLFAAFGYGVDRRGNVYQNGLVFLSSRPGASEVTITNVQTGKTQQVVTAERLSLPASNYKFEFLKQGYRPWQHDVELRGGGIERLVYPFLFPEQLVTTAVASYDKPPLMTTISPDRTNIVIQPDGKQRVLEVYDALNPTEPPRTVTIPASVLANAKNPKLTAVEWASNNRQLLLQRKTRSGSDFVIVDIVQPAQSININQRLDVSPKQVSLFDKRAGEVFVHLPDNRLLRGNLQNGSLQTELDDVIAFKPHGDDTILYATTQNRSSRKNVTILLKRDAQSYKLRELPKGGSYLLDLARFDNHWNIVLGTTISDHVYIYRDPIETLTSSTRKGNLAVLTMKIKQPQHVSFSENTQFIAAQSGGKFVVYNALDGDQFSYEIKTPFDTARPARWMDGHRLVSSSNGAVVVFDFDGVNYQTLNSTLPSESAMFDRDYDRMFTIARGQDKKYQLQATLLQVQ